MAGGEEIYRNGKYANADIAELKTRLWDVAQRLST
jgi:hypothetical protein